MKIALFGQGKTGSALAEEAKRQGHEVIAVFTRSQRPEVLLTQAAVAFDFSHASAIEDHVELCLKAGVPLIVGTTGWTEQVEGVKRAVRERGGKLLTSPNFSLGMLLFCQLLATAARLMNPHPEYDVAGVEIHHKGKKDAPSGTALALQQILARYMPRLSSSPPFTPLRVGSVVGEHTVLFDSAADSISLQHTAKNRNGFASGALLAADWLLTKPAGFYTLNEWMAHV